VLQERIQDIVGDVPIIHEIVDEPHQEMYGSPTLLIDGVNYFRAADEQPSVSCRIDGVPSVAQLRAILDNNVLRSDRRLAPAGLRDAQQAILRAFATGSELPDVPDDVLDALHEGDFVRVDSGRRIVSAYPFSGVPTSHRVTLPNGVEVFAMCAIDALGISPMLDADATIFSTDPHNGDTVTVTFRDGRTTWNPPGAAVVLTVPTIDGPAAEVCCRDLNFFTSKTSAQSWVDTHHTGLVLTPAEAEHQARNTFGSLLR
jgi:hypothetical protein